jgi:hypothetical protein
MAPITTGPEGTRYIRFSIDVWFDEGDEAIHITSPDNPQLHTTVNDKPNSKRRHENLYGKLSEMLKQQGRPT